MDIFENISDVFPFYILRVQKGSDIYDKKRILSIYYNITPILSSTGFTSKIAKNI